VAAAPPKNQRKSFDDRGRAAGLRAWFPRRNWLELLRDGGARTEEQRLDRSNGDAELAFAISS